MTTYLCIEITRYVERKKGRVILPGCHFQIIAFRLTKYHHVVVLNANIAVNHAILKLFKLTRVGVPPCFSNLREEHIPLPRFPDLNGVPSGWTTSPHFYQCPYGHPHFHHIGHLLHTTCIQNIYSYITHPNNAY